MGFFFSFFFILLRMLLTSTISVEENSERLHGTILAATQRTVSLISPRASIHVLTYRHRNFYYYVRPSPSLITKKEKLCLYFHTVRPSIL